jgi:hypothetical protein
VILKNAQLALHNVDIERVAGGTDGMPMGTAFPDAGSTAVPSGHFNLYVKSAADPL